MLELFPEGFEEIDGEGGIEIAAYTNAAGEERIWQAFGGAAVSVRRRRLGGPLAPVPPAGPGRQPLDRPALGAA